MSWLGSGDLFKGHNLVQWSSYLAFLIVQEMCVVSTIFCSFILPRPDQIMFLFQFIRGNFSLFFLSVIQGKYNFWTSRGEDDAFWNAHCDRYILLLLWADSWLEICNPSYSFFFFFVHRHRHTEPKHTTMGTHTQK